MYSMVEYLKDYEACHQNKLNRVLHLIGVPAIIVALMIFFSWIRVDFFSYISLSVSWLIVFAILIYYGFLDIKVTLAMSVFYIILNFIVSLVVGVKPSWASFSFFIVLLVGGWVLLLFGHFLEKEKPAFTKNLVHLLIGPIFIVNEVAAQFGLTLCKIDDNSDL